MSPKSLKPGFLPRLYRALGPVAAGLILDFADLATFGPIGIVAGFFVGVAVALWISSMYRFSLQTKVVMSLLAGVYCMIPMTELLPLATLIAATSRFFDDPVCGADKPEPTSQTRRKRVESTEILKDEKSE